MSDLQYQSLAGPLTTAQPLETASGWQAQHPPPPRLRGIVTALTVAACIMPATFTQGSANAPTDWRPTYQDRVIRKTVPAAQQVPFTTTFQQSLVFSVGGKLITLGSTELWQYQWIAEPFNIPTPPPLEWTAPTTYADRVYPLAGAHPSRVQAWAMDRFAAPSAATVPDLPWTALPMNPIPLRSYAARAPFMAADLDRGIGTPTEFNLRFLPRGIDRRLARASVAPYVLAQPHFPVIVDVPVMSWTGCYLDPPSLLKRRATAAGATGMVDVTTTVLPPYGWPSRYPDRVPARPRSLATLEARSVAPLYLADVTVTAPAMSWQGRFPERVPARRALMAGAQRAWTMDATFTAPGVVVAPALAVPVYVHRVYGKPRPTWSASFMAPDQVPDVTQPVTGLSWAPAYPDRYRWTVPSPEFASYTTDTTTPHGLFRPAWVKFNTYTGPWDREPS